MPLAVPAQLTVTGGLREVTVTEPGEVGVAIVTPLQLLLVEVMPLKWTRSESLIDTVKCSIKDFVTTFSCTSRIVAVQVMLSSAEML
jgi:hypothetical protein